jgi:hypothetical protein
VRVSQFYFALFCPRPGVPVDRDDVFGLFQLRGPYFLCSVTVTRSASTPSSEFFSSALLGSYCFLGLRSSIVVGIL